MSKKKSRKAPSKPTLPIRGKLLNDARDLTLGPRNEVYGDPLNNFQTVADLKTAFWTARVKAGLFEGFTSLDAFGHGIDMLLTNLGRIATAPTIEAMLAEDRYRDGVNYLALAFEVAKRSK